MPYEGEYDWTAGQSVSAYLMNRYVRDNLKHLYYACLPQRVTVWHDESLVTSGSALTTVVEASQPFNHYTRQSTGTAAVGDTWTQSVVLLEGTYRMAIVYWQSTTQGIYSVSLGSKLLVVLDAYAGSAASGISTVYFDLTTGGRYALTGTVTGKNASSSNYYCAITCIFFRPLVLVDGDL